MARAGCVIVAQFPHLFNRKSLDLFRARHRGRDTRRATRLRLAEFTLRFYQTERRRGSGELSSHAPEYGASQNSRRERLCQRRPLPLTHGIRAESDCDLVDP